MTKQERDRMIEDNIGLAKKIAYGYSLSDTRRDYDDVLQHGLIGLWKAVEKFDITKGQLFSTYAYYMISGEISNNILRKERRQLPTNYLSDLVVSNGDFELETILIDEKSSKYGFIDKDAFDSLLTEKAKLSKKQEIIIRLIYEEGYNFKQVENYLNCSKTSVYENSKNAISKLNKYWTNPLLYSKLFNN